MSPAFVLEPTYRRLKALLIEGALPPGARLEATKLAEEFGVSMTPVRDSLNQLTGEGLVDFTPGEGFRVPSLSEHALRDILQVNFILLGHSISRIHPEAGRLTDADSGVAEGYSERLASLFVGFAEASRNRFLLEQVRRINERLNMVRKIEPRVIPNADQLILELERSARFSDRDRRLALESYHRTCLEHVPLLIEGKRCPEPTLRG